MMTFDEFLDQVVADGIEAAKADYKNSPDKLEGSIAGFSACLNKTPEQLATLLAEARADTIEIRYTLSYIGLLDHDKRYWYWRCREAEIEWVCNVMSAGLLNAGFPIIVQPTARGVLKAAAILGVQERVS